ncbi:MAG: cysteine--tRNA ligase, partial [Acidimicrobiales bacterium]
MLRLHDTATGAVGPLDLRDEGRVSMYVCGPTVYDLPHLGHGRYALAFDVLRRYLLFTGLDVRYVSNVTDVDDHIIQRAEAEGRGEPEVAAEYEARWWEAMDALGVLRPTETPHATAYVAGMVNLVVDLVARGAAYEISDGVYLEIARVDGYGLLAHQPLESLRAGARVEASTEKRSPLDFALWKKAKPGEPSWPSPWGPGRPGWHTECVVMSLDLLGDGFDLHGGAIDLIFPHHENERAQAVAEGRAFARHWVHNGWVMVGGEKMSKSLGNFTSLTDLLARSDARAYRLLVLRSHYRSPIEVTAETVADAEKALARLDALARRFSLPDLLAGAPGGAMVAGKGTAAGTGRDAAAAFTAAMDDDLDTPRALAGIFEMVNRAHALADAGDERAAGDLARTVAVL